MKNNRLSIVVAIGVGFFGAISLHAQQYVWSQYAGNSSGGAGFSDQTGSLARFSYPNSVAVDASGTVYVADTGNHTIRKLVFSGTICTVSTLAGTVGVSGTTDGTGSAALFNSPLGIAVDASGNVYVADTGNHTIRKVSSSGQVITLAGMPGIYGDQNGAGTSAQFCGPIGIAVDASGTVYVADTGNHTIRKITSGGAVTTLAGCSSVTGFVDGTGSGALFNSPGGLALDGSGNLIVADTLNNLIRKVTPAGGVTTLAGSLCYGSFDGTGTNATFNLPSAVAVDGAGNVYVADTYNATIRMIAPDGGVTTLSGSTCTSGFVDGAGTAAKFNFPGGIAVDASGTVYVADTCNHTIRKMLSNSVFTVAGSAPKVGTQAAYVGYGFYISTPYNFYYGSVGIALDASGNVFSTDTQNQLILKNGSPVAGKIGQMGNQDGTGSSVYFNNPTGIAIDGGTNFYVADSQNNSIRMLSPTYVSTTICGGGGTMGSADGSGTNAQFNNPVGIALDGGTNLYVADTYNSTIRKLTGSGANWSATTIAGSAGVTGTTDGSASLFSYPSGIAVDSGTNVYVADSGNATIRCLTFSGGVWRSQTIAGTPGVTGTADGVGMAAQFGYPTMMSFDSMGNLFVVDSGNSTVRLLTKSGSTWTVTTVGGTPGVNGGIPLKGDAGPQVQFSAPMGIAIQSGTSVGTDRLFVMDSGNNRVVVGQTLGTQVASGITKTSGTVSGWVNPNGQDTQVYFQYGKTTGYGSVTGTQSIGNGFTDLWVSSSLAGLSGYTTYNYQMVVVNASGTFYGLNQTFSTLPGFVPSISSTTSMTGTVGMPLSYTIKANYSPTVYGATPLPSGLSFNPLTGVISGIPTVSGSSNLLLSATNGVGTGTATLSLKIIDLPLPQLTSSGTTTTIYGSLLNYTIGALNNVTSYSATGLPSWLMVNPISGLISGVPTEVGTFPVTVSAVNNSGTSTMPLVITVTPPYVWNNFVGNPGTQGSSVGTGTNAQFQSPWGVAIDSGSNLYISDRIDCTIKKVTSAGVVTKIAGQSGVAGFADGPGANAKFNYPCGIALDSGSNLYVADYQNHRIRKITPNGTVSTLAGTGVSGTANGPGSTAQFNYPDDIAVDSGSNVYVTDSRNYMIRMITPSGGVSTLAGSGVAALTDGTGVKARFYSIGGIALDSGSNLYVLDQSDATYNYTIRLVTPAGVVTSFPVVSNPIRKDGSAYIYTFIQPSGITVDSGTNLYVSDFNEIRKMSLTSGPNGPWTVTTIGGYFPYLNTGMMDGIGLNALFDHIQKIAIDSSGNLFVADNHNYRISKGSILTPPTITSSLAASGTESNLFNYTITASNYASSFNATGPTLGLSIDSQAGLISGTPTANGTFAFTITASNPAGTGTATLQLSLLPGSIYQAWQGQVFAPSQIINPTLTADLATPAGDGISNLMKYALHLNPATNGVSGLPVKSIVTVSGTNYPALTYTKVKSATDLTYTVQVSTDLQTWNSGASYTTTMSSVNNPDGVTQSITVRSLVPVGGGLPKQFIRLQVSH